MLLFLHGEDSFRIHERITILRTGFQNKYDTSGINVVTLQAKNLKPDQLRSHILSSGLFSSKRFIVIQDIFELPEASAEAFVAMIPGLDANNIVVCTAEQIPKADSALKQILIKGDHIEIYSLLEPAHVIHWMQQRLLRHHKTMTKEAGDYILAACGSDLWKIHHVLEQGMQCADQITEQHVQQFLHSPLDDNIFHLTDALAGRQSVKAMQLLEQQYDSGTNVQYLITMLARQLGILIEVKEATTQPNTSPNTPPKGMHAYVYKKANQHAQRFSLDQLKKLYNDLVEIDYISKQRKIDTRLLLQRFILKATG